MVDREVSTLPSRSLRAGNRALPGAGRSHQVTQVVEPGGTLQDLSLIHAESCGEGFTVRTPRQELPRSCFPRPPNEAAGTKGGLAILQSLVLPAQPSGLMVFKGPEPRI